MAVFDDARARLPESDRALVDACLAIWSADPDWCQVAANLRAEPALPIDDLAVLLGALATRFAATEDALRTDAASWRPLMEDACKPHEFRGAQLPDGCRPQTLGRAWAIGSLARMMSKVTKLNERAALRLLGKHLAETPCPPHLRACLAVTPIGGALIWATFDPADSARDPFKKLPPHAAAVRCSLGLGCHAAGEPILALTYTSASPAHGLPLYRPTVADANSYFYYRPHGDPATPWGFTAPLDPNPDGLLGMPEVVHGQVTGAALIDHRILW